jgi:LPXTG-motif cell wall-anchored protein
MKDICRIVAIAAFGVAAFVGFAPAAHAAAPAQVTLTFRLTLSGTVPAHDLFLATFGENGAQFCGPCAGGHTYQVRVPWPKGGNVVAFRLDRETRVGCVPIGQGSSSCPSGDQHQFAQFNVRPTANQTFNAVFAYGNASVAQPAVPATGSGVDLLAASGLIAFGAGLVTLSSRRRRRATPLEHS